VAIHNLPIENILMEEAIKKEIKKRISRGKIEVFVLAAKPRVKKVSIDADVVAGYISQIKSLAGKYNLEPRINLTEVLNLPQAVVWEEKEKTGAPLVMPALKEAIDKLMEFKRKEGEAIRKEIMANLGKLKNNMEEIKRQKPNAANMENGKEDIDEEISLAMFYIGKMDAAVNSKKGKPIGKTFDFLTQEILRELNAASSKTKKKTPAFLIVEAKNYLERIKEQAQNIE